MFEDTVEDQRSFFYHRKLIGQLWWYGGDNEQTGTLRHRPVQCSSSTLWIGSL